MKLTLFENHECKYLMRYEIMKPDSGKYMAAYNAHDRYTSSLESNVTGAPAGCPDIS
jgi:hypothetical protein